MTDSNINYQQLAEKIKFWGKELGFQQVGIADINIAEHEALLEKWLSNNYHGEMEYMASHGLKRARPAELLPGTQRVITVRMDYLPPDAQFAKALKNNEQGYISRYANGRDYHKLMRNRLKKLAEKIKSETTDLNYRPFVDSAPVLERQLADKAGLGWTGKHSLLINKDAGSWFFLGEIFVDIPLPLDSAVEEKCGNCVACITMCPTNAIVEPYVVDARKCISYLTIELKGEIPEEYRPLIGNKIYGCDDCQLVCPWNRYAQITDEQDFHPRKDLYMKELLVLFAWDEETFLKNTEGSAIRRIGHERWLRNISVALGNATYNENIVNALKATYPLASTLVKTHINWALAEQNKKMLNEDESGLTRKHHRLIKTIEKGLPRDA